MYLHEAMEKLFRQVGRSMTTKEIAEKLNENMEALKHNFLFRGYFRKAEHKQEKDLKKKETKP